MAKRHRLLLAGGEHTVSVDETPEGVTVAIDEGDPIAVEVVSAQLPGVFSFLVDGAPRRAFVSRRAGGYEVTVAERRFRVEAGGGGRRARGVVGGAEDVLGQITAPLAGVVVDVRTAVGDEVAAGTTVAVLEAMKMQNEVLMPRDGTITALHVSARDNIDKGALLVEYDPADDPGE